MKVKVKKDIIGIKKNQRGKVTAYLPEMNRFAVIFGNGRWHTYKWTEEMFLDYFDVEEE